MDQEQLLRISNKLKNYPLERQINIMEVCGTHTTEFFRTGVKDIFPPKLHLIDGPGCPVCVTSNDYLDRAIEIGRKHGAIIATFGDMLRVPSSYSSLQKEKADGMDIRVVYSPLDAVKVAQDNPDKEVVFLSVGFETTTPSEAAAVKVASNRGVENFSLLVSNKLTPPAVKALLDLGEVNVEGLILPGHVSTITGVAGWRFIADDYGVPCVIAGFENHDMIAGTLMLLDLILEKKGHILNEYQRAVNEEGNMKAQKLIAEMFDVCEANWRGVGVIPASGLKLKDQYSSFDAVLKLPVEPPPPVEPKGCRCGEILRGLIAPPDCPLFGKKCTPQTPVGACMVSSEGSCGAFYKYGRD